MVDFSREVSALAPNTCFSSSNLNSLIRLEFSSSQKTIAIPSCHVGCRTGIFPNFATHLFEVL